MEDTEYRMHDYRKKTRVSRWLKGLVRADIGLITASIAVLAIGLALALSGTDTIGSGRTELGAQPTGVGAIHLESLNVAVPVESQVSDGSGVRIAASEAECASAVERTETASEPLAASTPSATFDERFYFDQHRASFEERFASAFGSSGDAAGEVAEVVDPANDMPPQQVDFGESATGEPALTQPAPANTSRHASLREERLNTAEASLGVSLPLDSESHTAIYDIAARTVYLPDGHRLEAHSGLGSHLDDPRYVNTKGRGPTPPNIYNLTLRERLFHGVRAIRLVPVDNGKMFGRDGILAHTYMLGPSGQSNGCVSFRNYSAFLNAFLKGEVDRLVVVEHLATVTGASKVSTASGG
jgi:hypothetical protein